MPILDFTTLTQTELEAYFAEHATLRHDAGYSNYQSEFVHKIWTGTEEVTNFQQNLIGFFAQESISGAIDVLELGGALGHRAEFALTNFGLKSWEIIDLYDSPNKKTHAKLTYTFGDARTILTDTKVYRDNSKDIVLSHRFLECVPESDLPALIANMNRIEKQKQYHVISQGANSNYYSTRDLAWWATQGFNAGTVLISHVDFISGNFDNVVRVV